MRLLLLIVAAVVVRLIVVYATDGVYYDLNSWRIVYDTLRGAKLDVYDSLEPQNWPYGPGYMPWIAFAGKALGFLDFFRAVRLGAVLADVGIIWLVHDLLRRAGASERRRLAGAALIAFGPLCVGVAGYNGQLDPGMTLPALLAYWVWTRPGQRHRGWWTGALLGVAGAVKTVPLLLCVPVAAAARTRGEALSVAIGAGAVFLAAIVPFSLSSLDLVDTLQAYSGIPGFGGIGLFVEPTRAVNELAARPFTADPDTLLTLATGTTKWVLGPAFLLLAGVLAVKRPDALTGICLTYLVVYVFGVNFIVNYLIWAIPFFVVRGHLVGVLVLQLALTPAMLVTINFPVAYWVALVFYSVAMGAAWVYGAGLLGAWTYRLVR